jgi:hypothetical protein
MLVSSPANAGRARAALEQAGLLLAEAAEAPLT